MVGWIVVGGLAAVAGSLYVVAGEEGADPRRPRARSGAQRCPFCHAGLGGEVRRCDACTTLHHEECWGEHGGCAVFACEAGGTQGARALTPAVAEGTSSEQVGARDPAPGGEAEASRLEQRPEEAPAEGSEERTVEAGTRGERREPSPVEVEEAEALRSPRAGSRSEAVRIGAPRGRSQPRGQRPARPWRGESASQAPAGFGLIGVLISIACATLVFAAALPSPILPGGGR